MRVGVVIPTVRRPTLARTLEALSLQPWHRLLVVYDDWRNISNARNKGWATLYETEVICFCDDDAVPDPDYVAEGMEAMKNLDVGTGLVYGGFQTSEECQFAGTALWVTVRALQLLSGFSTDFVDNCGWEDVDLGWRAMDFGLHCGLMPHAGICHPTAPQHEIGKTPEALRKAKELIAKRHPRRWERWLREGRSA
jgi:GT2 family glycosyltransferase